jgi:hypothetical protein
MKNLEEKFTDLMSMSDMLLDYSQIKTHGYYFKRSGILTFEQLENSYKEAKEKTSRLSVRDRNRVVEAYEELISNALTETKEEE